MGRKNKYDTNVKPHLNDIPKWYETMNEKQICKKLGISVASFAIYKNTYPELANALNQGKEILIEDLKDSLKMKAKGYEYTETKTTIRVDNGKEIKVVEKYRKYAHPDTGAIHLLLKNLDPSWHNDDKQTMEIKKEQLELARIKAEKEDW